MRTVAALLLVLASPALLPVEPVFGQTTPVPGWRTLPLPESGSTVVRYLPPGADVSQPLPAVLFLHGAGTGPLFYRPTLEPAAEERGVVVVGPRSTTDNGWGFSGDLDTVFEALSVVGEELSLDPARISIAGHSAGGAYAFLLAYMIPNPFNAVFSLSAPHQPISEILDPTYVAPIRMYYGTEDLNFQFGAYDSNREQWERLGVPWEEDIRGGWGHTSWPQESMDDGFDFLLSVRRPEEAEGEEEEEEEEGEGGGDPPGSPEPALCTPDATALCLLGRRFVVTVTWQDFEGDTGPGSVVPNQAEDSGLFWFFRPDNWELLVKVLDGCGVNGHFWVFVAATTNVGYEVEVEHLESGESRRYVNLLGDSAPAVTDTTAFANCP